MSTGKIFQSIVVAILVLLSSCGGSSSSNITGSASVASVTQDLTLNPDGLVTVIVFSNDPGSVALANLESDGGQSPTLVAKSGSTLTVTWNQRVTPADQVRIIGLPGIGNAYNVVTTTL